MKRINLRAPGSPRLGARLPYIDSLRGLAIVLVVLGHVLQHYYDDEALACRIVYSFHIPLFMFVSGYVGYTMRGWSKVPRRAIQLLVPFFSAMVLSFVIKEWGAWTLGGLLAEVRTGLWQPDLALWFLWALFFIQLLFVSTRWLAERIRVAEPLALLGVAALLNGIEVATGVKAFGYHWIAWYFIYFSAGALWRQFMAVGRPRVDRAVLIVCACLFPVAVCLFHKHATGLMLGVRLAAGFIGTGLCYEVYKLFPKLNNRYQMLMGGGNFGHLLFALPPFAPGLPLPLRPAPAAYHSAGDGVRIVRQLGHGVAAAAVSAGARAGAGRAVAQHPHVSS